MKRSPPRLRTGIREGDILQAFSKKQLAWIGACAMAYNEAESLLHIMAGNCLDFPGNDREVTSRINGTDGLIAIIRAAVAAWGDDLGPEVHECLELALAGEGFPQMKSYRDAVIHANLTDSDTAVAHNRYHARGSITEILLSEAALERLYNGLVLVAEELEELSEVVYCAARLSESPAPDDPQRAQLLESIRAAIAQCQDHQRHRRSLGPFPKFPGESQISESSKRSSKRRNARPGAR